MAKYVRFYSFAIVCSQWKTFLYQFLLSKSSHGRVLFHIKVFLQYWFEHSALWVRFFCKKNATFFIILQPKKFLVNYLPFYQNCFSFFDHNWPKTRQLLFKIFSISISTAWAIVQWDFGQSECFIKYCIFYFAYNQSLAHVWWNYINTWV